MSTHCSKRQVASAGGLGGADTARAYKHPSASRHGRPDGGAVGCQVGRGGVAVQGNTECWLGPVTGRIWVRGATRRLGRTGAKRTLWARLEHARDMLDEKLGHPRGCG